jgi:predicted lipoprotein with Yx(FWY)xxD motif
VRIGVAITVGALALAPAAGCGDAGTASAGPEKSGASKRVTLQVVQSRYGKVIADSTGEALYLFTRDGRGPSRCYGACATAWPPFLTKSKPRPGTGIAARGLGTARRRDGKLQVTYRGQPLYYYVADSPGKILCQNVHEYGGDWLVIAPTGKAIR